MSNPELAADLIPTYADAGLPVFPLHHPVPARTGDGLWCSCGRPPGDGPGHCGSAAKHPVIGLAHRKGDPARGRCRGECGRPGHGVWDATTDLGQIAEWLARWPDANWAVHPPAGVVVLDIDPRNGGDTSLADLEAQHAPLPATLTCRTGSGGFHLWLTHDGPSRGKLATGIDVKKHGGYLVAPPSQHITGGTYTWTDQHPAAHIPGWVRDILDPPRPAAPAWLDGDQARRGGIDGLVKFLLAAKEGERNSRLYWCAARAHESRLDTGPLIAAAESLGTPRTEAEATARSAAHAPARTVSARTDRWDRTGRGGDRARR